MKIRLIAITLLLLPLSLMAAPIVDLDFSSASGFTVGSLGGQSAWSTPTGSTSASVVPSEGSSPVSSDQTVHLPGSSSSSVTIRNEYIFTDSPLTSPFTIDVWMKRSSGKSIRDSYVNISTQSSAGNGIFIGFDDDRFFYQKDGNDNLLTTETYTANTWYRFHLEVIPELFLYSVTIYDTNNDIVVATMSDLAFRGGRTVPSIDLLRMTQQGGSGGSDLYIGAMTVSVIPEPATGMMSVLGLALLAGSFKRRKL